ncbi:MAG: alpha/beta hydrolase fold domain-containing protein [Bacteroidetes bacterium]|nr:alpha/beta hydrolase fold domain-containing protein [Bacteroidota bacterium]
MAKKNVVIKKREKESLASRVAKQTLRASLWPYRSVAFGRSTINLSLLRFFPSASGVQITRDKVGGIPGERHRPLNQMANRKLLFFHGGGYTGGSSTTHRAMVSRIAKACKAETFVADYRLAPRHPFPAALRDAKAVFLAWMREHPDASHFIAGDSAGGGLTTALLYQLRDQNLPLPQGAVLLSPWMDVRMEHPDIALIQRIDPMLRSDELRHYGEQYAAGHDLDDPLISPAEGDPHGLPPILLQIGQADILYPDAERFSRKALASGVKLDLESWPDMMHVWHAASMMPEARQAVRRIGEWVGAQARKSLQA